MYTTTPFRLTVNNSMNHQTLVLARTGEFQVSSLKKEENFTPTRHLLLKIEIVQQKVVTISTFYENSKSLCSSLRSDGDF